MGKTRNLIKKTGEIVASFHARVPTIKDRNCKDLTEAEEIKKRWQEYIKNYTKKALTTWMTLMMWSFTYSQTSWGMKSSGP